jgi:hypothetical protein|uniref:Uncharacterized protein n=1 Tax=Populus trichocarpa TaxID=3694 RepID=A0A3N7FII4_POPTR
MNLSAELWQGIGLFRLATGSSYIEIADRFGVTEQLCSVSCTYLRALSGRVPFSYCLLKEMIANQHQLTRFKMTALLFKLLSIHLKEF